MNPQHTGKKIAELRKGKSLTQRDVADQLHVSVSAVSKWERGLNYPDLSLMEPLSQFLGISVSELLGLEHESADFVIRNITELSEQERSTSKQTLVQKTVLICMTAMLFFILTYLVLVIGREDELVYILFQHGGTIGYNLLAIGLGTTAWIMAIAGIFSRHDEHRWKRYAIASFLCCSLALYIPTLITDLIFRFENYGTIEDTIWGYNFASIALLLGTVLFNICAWLLRKIYAEKDHPKG